MNSIVFNEKDGYLDNKYMDGKKFQIKNIIPEKSTFHISDKIDITDYTKYRAQGLNPTTISELTGIPRASVIRKLKELRKDKFLFKNKQNLFTVITAKESPAAFKKLSNIFEKNQLLLRYCLKDLLNYMFV